MTSQELGKYFQTIGINSEIIKIRLELNKIADLVKYAGKMPTMVHIEKDKEDELFKLGCHIRTCAQTETKGKVDFVGNESLIPRARNMSLAKFIYSDFTHLLFIDSDIEFPVQAVIDLIKVQAPPAAAASKPCDTPAPADVKICQSVPRIATTPEPLILCLLPTFPLINIPIMFVINN